MAAVRIVYENFVKKKVKKGYFQFSKAISEKLKTLYQKSAVLRFLGYL